MKHSPRQWGLLWINLARPVFQSEQVAFSEAAPPPEAIAWQRRNAKKPVSVFH